MTDIGKMKVTKKQETAQVIPILEMFNTKEDNLTIENNFKCKFIARGHLEKSNEVKNLDRPVCSLGVTRVFIALCTYFNGTLRQADVTSVSCTVN